MTTAQPGLSVCWRPSFDGQGAAAPLALAGEATVYTTPDYLRIAFGARQRALSSAILNGGLVDATDFLNLRVDGDIEVNEAPEVSLQRFAAAHGCGAHPVGMMTAASMKSLRVATDRTPNRELSVLVTTGLDNARRAGDPADYDDNAVPPAGTINLAIVAAFPMPAATMAEMLMLATEAKAAVLQELAITSPVSGAVATGTGTDATAVFTPAHCEQVVYAGKHTRLGQILATLVMDAVRDSISDWPRNSAGETDNA